MLPPCMIPYPSHDYNYVASRFLVATMLSNMSPSLSHVSVAPTAHSMVTSLKDGISNSRHLMNLKMDVKDSQPSNKKQASKDSCCHQAILDDIRLWFKMIHGSWYLVTSIATSLDVSGCIRLSRILVVMWSGLSSCCVPNLQQERYWLIFKSFSLVVKPTIVRIVLTVVTFFCLNGLFVSWMLKMHFFFMNSLKRMLYINLPILSILHSDICHLINPFMDWNRPPCPGLAF